MLESYTIKLHHEKKTFETAAKQGILCVISALKVKSSLGLVLIPKTKHYILFGSNNMSIVKGFNLLYCVLYRSDYHTVIIYINLCCSFMKTVVRDTS